MTQTKSAYRRQWMGLDKTVWLVFITMFSLSAILLGFKLATHVPCSPIAIAAKGTVDHDRPNLFYINEGILFTASMKDQQKISWDFGDGSPLVEDSAAAHFYINEGTYPVTVTVNDKCTELFMVRIKKKEPVFVSNTENSKPATGDTMNSVVTQTNNIDLSQFDLGPLPNPPELDSTVVIKKLGYVQVPDEEMKSLLEQAKNKQKILADFKNILCRGADTKVDANGKIISFEKLLSELQDKRGLPAFKHKPKITSVAQVYEPDQNNRCVSLIHIKYHW